MSNDNGETTVCPACDSTDIERRTPSIEFHGRIHSGWACKACGDDFKEPERRERKTKPGLRGDSLAARLDRADPSEVAGE